MKKTAISALLAAIAAPAFADPIAAAEAAAVAEYRAIRAADYVRYLPGPLDAVPVAEQRTAVGTVPARFGFEFGYANDYRFRGQSLSLGPTASALLAARGQSFYADVEIFGASADAYPRAWTMREDGQARPASSGKTLGITTAAGARGFLTPYQHLGSYATWRAGVTSYHFQSARYIGYEGAPRFSWTEVTGALGFVTDRHLVAASIDVSVTPHFGLNETTGGKSSVGSTHVGVDYTYSTSVPGLVLKAAAGHQHVAGYSELSRSYASLGARYTVRVGKSDVTAGIDYIGVRADQLAYSVIDSGTGGVRSSARSGWLASVRVAF